MGSRKPKTFGERLRMRREELSLGLREAAELATINPSHLMRLERDEKRPTAGVADRLAKVLRLNAEDLKAQASELPRFAPYLRAKYDLDDQAIAELEEHFKAVSKRGRS